MECEKCPVKACCKHAKRDQLIPLMPDPQEEFRPILELICPLETAVQLHVSALGIQFGNYLISKRRFEGKK